jgi:hypothetical protein
MRPAPRGKRALLWPPSTTGPSIRVALGPRRYDLAACALAAAVLAGAAESRAQPASAEPAGAAPPAPAPPTWVAAPPEEPTEAQPAPPEAVAEPRVEPSPAPAGPGPASPEPRDLPPPTAEAPPLPTVPRFVLREDTPNPLRESVLTFEQSITTQTAGIGQTPQSYVPLYELWVSFRPRYHFDEHWSVRGRVDYTKEVTNAEQTTYRNEDVFGDIWTDLVYETKLDRWWRGTRVHLGLRAIWPTSKISEANGMYLTLGPRVGASHVFPIHGEDAPWLNDFAARFMLVYLHEFSAATTPTDYGSFGYVRENVDDRSFLSDAINGQTLPEHELDATVSTQLQISPRLSVAADVYLLNQWHYAPTGNVNVGIAGGSTVLPPAANDNQFTEFTWITAEVAYDVINELTLSLGYYNLANAVAPDGQGRSLFGSDNIWWSPGARMFFDVTANLDSLFDDARGHRYSTAGSSQGHTQRVANHVR